MTYKEQDEEKVAEYLEKIENIEEEDIVYVDETGIQQYLHREYAWAPRGEKVQDVISGRRFKRMNIVAAKQGDTILAPLQYTCSMTGDFFEFWFETSLLSELPEHAVVVMDNASFHRKKKLNAIAQAHQITLIFLPPYSPELNPIEKEWANLKRWLKFHLHLFTTLDDAVSYYFKVN